MKTQRRKGHGGTQSDSSAKTISAILCALCASAFSFGVAAAAAEPFFKENDVIALVGGEDMVAMSEYGYLELLLQRALPDYHLKFRDLAWEGDTVFEQHRDLNFPPLEAQLDQVGATVVICQFGQMESLGKGGTRNTERGNEAAKETGRAGVPPAESGILPGSSSAEFIAAYEKLIERMRAGGKRRIVLLAPLVFSPKKMVSISEGLPAAVVDEPSDKAKMLVEYITASKLLAEKLQARWLDPATWADPLKATTPGQFLASRDGIHLSDAAHAFVGSVITVQLERDAVDRVTSSGIPPSGEQIGASTAADRALADAIHKKNRLWFNYWRVENWAFLAGDRTEQPSSRDHLDRTRRWFPAEREQFLPLIEKKEQEIWALAAKLAKP